LNRAHRFLAIFAMALFPTAARAMPGTGAPPPSCGPAALSELCRREGFDVGIDRICERLGEMPSRGYSMAQLARAAGDFGLRLEGVRLGIDDRPAAKPFLAHISRQGEGHFFVVAPLRDRPATVLVIDPAGEPRVIRFDQLVHLPGWTGVVLMRSDKDYREYIVIIILMLSSCFLVRGVRSARGVKSGKRFHERTEAA
jgi:ABC-type bacteriocin/lantibiotic exporter with double-glycine peptidase domain